MKGSQLETTSASIGTDAEKKLNHKTKTPACK
uniref:Uncharacterized protein n=1 Tax=Rhizophora mucronata TaxID=61149 RepID=A0A2P2KFL1_RHIMU